MFSLLTIRAAGLLEPVWFEREPQAGCNPALLGPLVIVMAYRVPMPPIMTSPSTSLPNIAPL
jgi:hypothetical protein